MSCISPTIVRIAHGAMLAPCGRCSQCIQSKVSALTFLAQQEVYQARRDNTGSSFVTLTYSNRSLPISDRGQPTLRRRDIQLFCKRLRQHLVERGYKQPLKILYCGEYGDLGRPHYHLAIIGCPTSLTDAAVRKSWEHGKYGLVDVKPMTDGAVGYICKYMSKTHPRKDVLEVYEANGCEPPFIQHSQKLGYNWIRAHAAEIIQSGYTYLDVRSGDKRLYPRYVRKLVESLTGDDSRPAVKRYMESIPTYGLSLDDCNTVRDYLHARASYLRNIKSGKADYILHNVRLPPNMRGNHDTDYISAAASI